MDQGKVGWKKDVREALCTVDELVHGKFFLHRLP